MSIESKLEEYFKLHTEEMLGDIAELIAIPSVRGEAESGKPFGEEPYKALCLALEKAKDYGFSVKNYDSYVGTVDYNNEETCLNIFAHLDVVAPGDGWSTDPYTMKNENGILFGRGVSDDKGPCVAALYALKSLKDLGISLKKNVRLVMGTDEECGSSDLEYYFKKETPAPWSFTPDANFPVTNGEKGRFSKNIYGSYNDGDASARILYIKGGCAGNAVPSFCEACVIGISEAELQENAILVKQRTGAQFIIEENKITCNGTSAHASLPHLGNNPITSMLEFLTLLKLDDCESTRAIFALNSLFPHGDYSGKAFGVDMEDKLGELTISLDIINIENGKVSAFFDTRTPMKATKENCADIIADKLSSYGLSVENTEMIPAHYVDENSPFVKTLLKRYEMFTGEKGECLSMGGGTYVHDIDGGVAFGAIRKDLNTNMHGANEFMYVEDLVTSAKIFASVIYDMCQSEDIIDE